MLWVKSQNAEYQKVKKVNNCYKNYWKNTMLKLKNRFIWEKKKHSIISETSWCNVLRRAGSDYCVYDNFPGPFVDFCLKIFVQEIISSYVDPCPQNMQL